jgi:EmrB/QacA subfamily drug resistance transporter
VSTHKEDTVMNPRKNWTLGIVSLALFMVVLDNLVVTVALPSIRRDLGASIQALEWTVNAYVLAYAVLLMTGAALGDRLGRRRMFVIGLGVFTAASAGAALAPTAGMLVAARAVQGAGAALVTPLTLTLLAEAFPAKGRGAALGIWSGVSGMAVAIGPLVGGAVTEGISWHWIFWINVPIGLVLAPLGARLLRESFGNEGQLDLPGLGLASAGLLGLVYGLIRAQSLGWTSSEVVTTLAVGVALLVAFVLWELRAAHPMLPMGFFKARAFSVTNAVSVTMYFGTFGSIFFITQFLQYVLGYSPLQAGVRMLTWTGATMLVAPIAGVLSERFGSRPFLVAGLGLQGAGLFWIAEVAAPGMSYGQMVIPSAMAGAGMALVFAPAASAVLGAVLPSQAGQASGANNALREVGGVFGVAVLATVFAGSGGYTSAQAFVDGFSPALTVGAIALGAGALLTAVLPWPEGGPKQAQAERRAAGPVLEGAASR